MQKNLQQLCLKLIPMTHHQSVVSTSNKKFALKPILLAGLVAGVLDGLAAVISVYLANGRGPEVVFKFVASGVFGSKAAFAGGAEMVIAGLIFHMLIATIWAAIFYFLYPVIRKARLNKVIVGLLYGIVVWMGMNLVVVPLSNTPPMPHTITGMLKGAAILMVCIGLPVSLIIGSYFEKSSSK
jgi:hypothetical protein